MKRNFLLALIGALCCVLQAFAGYVAPTFPSTSTPEGGGTYYLYNVATKKYFCFDSSKSNPKLDVFGTPVQLEGTTSSFVFKMDNIYMRGNGYYLERTDQPNDYSYWTLEATEAGYKLRNLRNADTYLGTSSSDDVSIRGNVSINAEWQLISVNEASTLYQGKQSLYNAMTAAEATGKGYDLSHFEQVYNSATATREDLLNAANVLNKGVSTASSYENCSWNEYPFLIMSSNSNFSGNYCYGAKDVKLFVNTNEQAFVSYRLNNSANDNPIEVYVDGKLVRTIDGYNTYISDTYFTERLTAGSHTVVWKVKQENYDKKTFSIEKVAVVGMPLISVSLLEPGSLGTEVLYNVDHLKKVKALKIAGTMNDDDWSKLSMMTSLTYLDLSEANIHSIPKEQFRSSKYPFLNEVKLPNTLKRIEDEAFAYSSLEYCELPENVEYVGNSAFYGTLLHHVKVPNSIKELKENVFISCYILRKAVLPDNLKTISSSLFRDCRRLSECNLPNQLEILDYHAFLNCDNISFSILPKSLKKIGEAALNNTASTKIIVPENVEISQYAFQNNRNLEEIEFPVSFLNGNYLLDNCPKLNRVIYKSATVVQKTDRIHINLSNVTIVVPDYLVNSYKLDSYWYNAKAIEGFDTEEVNDWQIYKPLVLGARDRFKGMPNVGVRNGGSLKINGDAAMTIKDFYTETHGNDMNYTAQMWSKCDNVSINGKVTLGYYTSANSWYYLSLPFNAKVGDITTQNGAQLAVRYYDGAARAANGVGASWKNYQADDIIAAGTGFILQTSKDGWVYFNGQDDESKQYIVSNNEFVKKLEANVSTIPANNGWNLVGNPYQSYYNAHKLNFTAPITLWDRNNRTYKAYSLIDDDIAIQPTQAFFVQCPDEVESISFPLEGRQLTSVIESQTAATPMNPIGTPARQIADVELSQGDWADQTRVVINEKASMAYEMARDASKFMSDDKLVPQVYTLDDEALPYAINERPLADGEVRLGFFAAHEGAFTLKAKRNDFEHLFLTDHATGTTTDIAQQAYHFNSEAGTYNSRFTLSFTPASEVTSMGNLTNEQQRVEVNGNAVTLLGSGMAKVFTADGKCFGQYKVVGEQTITVPAGVYVVSFNQNHSKITINR